MKTKTLGSCLGLFGLLFMTACSGSDTPGSGPGGTGGQSSTGGQREGGGAGGNAGKAGAGGTTTSGGNSASGGTTTTGGSGSGGAISTGGDPGTGGRSGGAGGQATGGRGGSSGSGGATATGGHAGGGGTISSGGTGGNAGGASGNGGSAGGNAGTAGAGSAGSSGAGGSGPVVSTCGLPAGPQSGVAAPTGAGTKITVLPWAGFKAATSISLDDGTQSTIDNYKTLNGMGVKLTFYLVTGWASAGNAVWKQAVQDGHEIGNHTQSHSCGTASAGQNDVKSKYGVTAYTLAAPNGDTACGAQAQSLHLLLNRGVGGGSVSFTAAESVGWNLPTSLPPQGASASTLISTIDAAYAKGEWQTFCIHGFSDGYQPIPLASLTDAIKKEKEKKDLWIDTMAAVGAYWRAGQTFAKTTASTSGSDKTWKWTVPTNFPPNTCLRVTTDGGVLKQKGATIPWNDHGYYELSFNAGEVTLSAQ